MTEPQRTFRVVLWGRPRADYEVASSTQQRTLDRVFDQLESDPFPDGVTKFYYSRLTPIGLTAYIDDDVRVVYQLVSYDDPNWQHWQIQIYSIELKR